MRADSWRPCAALVLFAAVLSSGCRQDMHDQPKYEPLEASTIFQDGKSSRSWVDGTVARGMLGDDQTLQTGRTDDDEFVTELPIQLDRALLERGQNRYDAFCSPCHGRTGDGRGMVVKRGFKKPTSFHDPRLQASPAGYFFNAITNGFGQMSSYRSQLSVHDRWAVTSYVQTLQLSRNMPADQLSTQELQQIEGDH